VGLSIFPFLFLFLSPPPSPYGPARAERTGGRAKAESAQGLCRVAGPIFFLSFFSFLSSLLRERAEERTGPHATQVIRAPWPGGSLLFFSSPLFSPTDDPGRATEYPPFSNGIYSCELPRCFVVPSPFPFFPPLDGGLVLSRSSLLWDSERQYRNMKELIVVPGLVLRDDLSFFPFFFFPFPFPFSPLTRPPRLRKLLSDRNNPPS